MARGQFLTGNASVLAFWAKVSQTDGCWLWKGHKAANGYGVLTRRAKRRKSILAHRFAYEIMFGEIPKGKLVCHHCDIPACVRPDHLFLGTPRQNTLDAKRKGRLASGVRHGRYTKQESTAHGEYHGRAKLTSQQVLDMRHLRTLGASQVLLSRIFNVGLTQIGRIVRQEQWRKQSA